MDRLIEFAGNHPWLVGVAVLAAALVIAYEMRTRAANLASIAPQDAVRLINQGALVLDIRQPQQYAEGHLGAARHLAANEILGAGESLKKHKEKPVIVYCDSGSLAGAAVRQLASQGFTKAVSLRGGLAAWRAENLPVARS